MALLNVPRALETDHEDLLDTLHMVLRTCEEAASPGRLLLEVLGSHFDFEAEVAGPLLAALSDSLENPTVSAAIVSQDLLPAFREAHPTLLQEHRTIAILARQLGDAGLRLDHAGAVSLSRRLLTHARLYDTILFPAALLAGQTVGRAAPERAAG